MTEDKLYYSILFINSEKCNTGYIPNNPFIYNCNFDNEKITIKQMSKMLKEDNVVVYYNEISQAELTVCSRLRGAPFSMMPTLIYNFDLAICTKNDSFHIEFQGCYDFKKVINIFDENDVLFNDKLEIFNLFDNEDKFKADYYNYFNKNFKTIATSYKLNNPRINYN